MQYVGIEPTIKALKLIHCRFSLLFAILQYFEQHKTLILIRYKQSFYVFTKK